MYKLDLFCFVALFLLELHFTYLLLGLVSFAIEFVAMMVLGFIIYTSKFF